MLTAEIIPKPNKSQQAARALQKTGFRVLSISFSITIEGEPELFSEIFNVRLQKLSKDVLSLLPESVEKEFYKLEKAPTIPAEFEELIKDILFTEPPEYY